jgi:predicted transporter
MLPALDVTLVVIAAFILGFRTGVAMGYRAARRRAEGRR